ncbi:MAG TPA: glycosyltransferase [Solirubrobacteraceae bacterium]|nr:glycosyltransferase [Solirubrobacteraceae bacterium]
MGAALPGERLRVAQFPPVDPSQVASFEALLERATTVAGARPVRQGRITPGWALRQAEVDVVHLHWLEYIAGSDAAPIVGLARTLVRTARLLSSLLILRLRGVGIVWTVHNLRPHEPVRPLVERALAEGVYLVASEVIVHSAYARTQVADQFRVKRRRPLNVIPHANYVDAFASGGPGPEEIVTRFDLPPGGYRYLAFGQVRRYKRLTLLTEQFSRQDGDDLRLLVVGRPNDHDEVERLRAAARLDPRIVLWLEHIADELVPGLHRACDAAVIAYEDVFSSGALLLALSYGLPVVAPSTGSARELFDSPAVEFFSGRDLGPALARVRGGAGSQQTEAALQAARAFPWSLVAEQTLAVYERAAKRS